jgi:acyl-CoA reductase-like NAD-dependent aldehyde dehydrogenase
VLSAGAVGAVEIAVLAGMGARCRGVRDVAPAFERATGHRVIVSFEAGPSLMQKVNAGAPADLVTHYPEVTDDLIKQGKVVGSCVDFARVAVVSATGSTAMGRAVGPRLAARFARAILELGGNNAAIVAPSADLDLALRAIAFAAMGTAGQRCTTQRLFVHANVYDRLVPRLFQVYATVKVGDPRQAGTLVGLLIDRRAFESMQRALAEAR